MKIHLMVTRSFLLAFVGTIGVSAPLSADAEKSIGIKGSGNKGVSTLFTKNHLAATQQRAGSGLAPDILYQACAPTKRVFPWG